MKSLLITAITIAIFSLSPAVHASYILLEESSFSGHVTNIDVADDWADVFKGGDIEVGSRFDANLELYDIGEGDGTLSSYTEYTFYGNERNYSFSVPADPFDWGNTYIDENGTLIISYNNNFSSDGLEETFFDYSSDAGYFDIELDDFDKPTIHGHGNFGWEGVDIGFIASPATSVDEPSVFAMLGIGLLLFSRRFSRGK